MKEFAPELAPIICDIYNQSLRKEYISSLLRYFIVTLFPKVCPPGAIEKDIRPISLTCTVSKIMKGFKCTRLLPQLEDKIDPRQYARKGHSTLDALLYKIASSDIRGGGHAVVRHVLGSFSVISLRDLILLITLF